MAINIHQYLLRIPKLKHTFIYLYLYIYLEVKHMKNTITFYVNDKEKAIYKEAKAKAKQEGRKISNVLTDLLTQYVGR